MKHSHIQITGDGSHTLYSNVSGETYHSSYGAIQESLHIFIKAGLGNLHFSTSEIINILEIGVGTGLNVILTYLWSVKNNISVDYHGYEPFPIDDNLVDLLNYPDQLNISKEIFKLVQNFTGNQISLSNGFNYTGFESSIQMAHLEMNSYDMVFFDAFSPNTQPELWTPEIFGKIYKSLKKGGVLTTYSCKGIVKRSLKCAGFEIEKLPGPPGKREFLRAKKV
jgi:tRNA U34 5-methylaminomethyl-2-thiouridine-forming methyltransferase MnmC